MFRVLKMAITGIFAAMAFGCGPVQFSTQDYNADGASQLLLRDVHSVQSITPPDNKLDILLVIDNSNSMLADNQKLAEKLAGFVSDLQNSSIDWRMCATVTSMLNVGGNPVWGASIIWSQYTPVAGTPAWVLKAGTPGLSTIFSQTINAIGAGLPGTDDERGIKAAWWHLYHGDTRYPTNSGCYRNNAALAMIVISDEDERSIGGALNDQYYQNEFLPLENDDLPTNLVSQVQDIFGLTKRLRVNSIIVKPDDTACIQAQDSVGSKSHFGRVYSDLSYMTGGGIGSICDADYSANLNYFKDVIQTSLKSVPLECIPHNSQLEYKINGSHTSQYVMELQGMSAVFTPALPTGTELEMNYQCQVE